MKIDLCRMKRGHFVLLPTFQCNITCDHCLHASGPHRSETMELGLFESILCQAMDIGFTTLCLSGGEPFLLPEHVRTAAALCRHRKCALVIQTNGFWGKNRGAAGSLLASMPGISQLGFSVDGAHLKFLGYDTYFGAIDAAYAQGISNLSISIAYGEKAEYERIKENLLQSFPGLAITGWPIQPIGRGQQKQTLNFQEGPFSWECLPRNCDIQKTFSPVVHPDGSLHGCYHAVMALEAKDPLILGNLGHHSLKELMGAVNNRLLFFLMGHGGGGLGYLIKDTYVGKKMFGKYIDVCHFCHDLLSDKETLSYVQDLLGTGILDARLTHGLSYACRENKASKTNWAEEILICQGRSCSKNRQNAVITNYLRNRLVETGKRGMVELSPIDCLNNCDNGPNLFLTQAHTLIPSLTREKIDCFVDQLPGPDIPPEIHEN